MKRLPVNIINLKKREDRRNYIINEFKSHREFIPKLIEPLKSKDPAKSLWLTIQYLVEIAKKDDSDFVIIVEDDHMFTDQYNKVDFFSAINVAHKLNADVLSLGVSWFNTALFINKNIFWVENFSGTQFIIIFKSLFDKIIQTKSFYKLDTADIKLRELTDNKYFLYPFLSIQKDFGYSDVTRQNNEVGRVDRLFTKSGQKSYIVKNLCETFFPAQKPKRPDHYSYDNYINDLVISTFLINYENNSSLNVLKKEFKNKQEFETNVVQVSGNASENIKKWKGLRKAIEIAISKDEDIIGICFKKHKFIPEYSKQVLFQNIIKAGNLNGEILVCGLESFDISIPIDQHLFWINSFAASNFFIIYKSIFKSILDYDFKNSYVMENVLSIIALQKMLLNPIISKKKRIHKMRSENPFLKSKKSNQEVLDIISNYSKKMV